MPRLGQILRFSQDDNRMDARLLLAGMTSFNRFPIKNVGNDSLSDELPFRWDVDVKRGSGITDSSTRGFTIFVQR